MSNPHVEEALAAKIEVEELEGKLIKARYRLTMALGTLSKEDRSEYARRLIRHHIEQSPV